MAWVKILLFLGAVVLVATSVGIIVGILVGLVNRYAFARPFSMVNGGFCYVTYAGTVAILWVVPMIL